MFMSSTMFYYFNTILIYKSRLGLDPRISSSITEKVALTITPLEWLVAMHVTFDKNTGRKTFKIKWIFASNLILSILKLYRAWVLCTSSLDSNCKGNSITRNAWSQMFQTRKIRALKKRIDSNGKKNMDSNGRYGPGHLSNVIKNTLQAIDLFHF